MPDLVNQYIVNIYPCALLPLIIILTTFQISMNIIIQGYRNRLIRSIFAFCLSICLLIVGNMLMIATPSVAFASVIRYL